MIQAAQDIAKTTLAACASFQELVGVDSAVDAAAFIYHDAWPPPISGRAEHTRAELAALRPSAIIYTGESQGFTVTRDAAGNDSCWNTSGAIHVMLFRNVPAVDKDNPSKVDTDFRTTVGDILEDMLGLSETAGYLAANQFTISGPHRTPVNELKDVGDAQWAEIVVAWGPGE